MWRRLDFSGLPVLVWEDEGHEKALPLVLFLHGAGERGVDGWSALRYGLPSVLGQPRPERMRVVVPQCPPECRWGDRLELLALLLDTLRGEAVTVTGFSMGGQGVWAFAEKCPDRVTRLAPVSARLPVGRIATELAPRLPDVPTWVIHGGHDERVPASESDAIVAALSSLGRRPTYTRYEGLGHGITCDKAYADSGYRAWLAGHDTAP
jgi:predicted peptidase